MSQACCAPGASHWPEVDPTIESRLTKRITFRPPVLETVAAAVSSPPLSLGVTEEKDGSILTGYQEFPGDWHVMRRWQERTRYRITVAPDWNEPTAAGRIEGAK